MGKTRLHTELAKCRNGITDWDNASRNTLNHCDRRNFEVGERRANKKSLIEKIIDKELKQEITLWGSENVYTSVS